MNANHVTPEKPASPQHRRSIRLPGYDYTQPGAYFITLVTFQREALFGDVDHGRMILSQYGVIADECWRAIPEHFPGVELGAFVVMPNHVHGIIILNGDDRRGTIYRAPTDNRAPTTDRAPTDNRAPTTEQFQKPIAGSIPTIIRTYKAAVTRRIGREHGVANLWQRNYYEHIIRNDHEHDRIRGYIESNPLNWNMDDENPEQHV